MTQKHDKDICATSLGMLSASMIFESVDSGKICLNEFSPEEIEFMLHDMAAALVLAYRGITFSPEEVEEHLRDNHGEPTEEMARSADDVAMLRKLHRDQFRLISMSNWPLEIGKPAPRKMS